MKITGPTCVDGQWHLYFEDDNGQRNHRTYSTKNRAESFRRKYERAYNKAVDAIHQTSLEEVPPCDCTAGWWISVIGALARRVAAGCGPEGRNNLKAIAMAASSVQRLMDYAELEAAVARLEEVNRLRDLAEKHCAGDVDGSELLTEVPADE